MLFLRLLFNCWLNIFWILFLFKWDLNWFLWTLNLMFNLFLFLVLKRCNFLFLLRLSNFWNSFFRRLCWSYRNILLRRFGAWLFFSYDRENLFMNVFFSNRWHFNIIFLLHFWSNKSPIDLKFDRNILWDILDDFYWYWQWIIRFNKTIARVHGNEVLFIGFDFENELMIWDICDIEWLTNI